MEKIDKYFFLWLKLDCLHPCKNDQPNRVSNYREYFDELENKVLILETDLDVVLFINLKN